MLKPVGKIVKQLAEKPKMLFLTDGIGAFLTAFSLFLISKNFNEYFGMPETTLTYLSAIAVCLCIYSTTCFFFLQGNWVPFIRGISIANLLYCMLTFGLILFNYPPLNIIGTTYFLLEIAIVCGLVYLELSVATAIKKKGIEGNVND